SEYLMEHGMVDMVVPRTELRDTIANILSILMKRESLEQAEEESTESAEAASQEASTEQQSAPAAAIAPAASVETTEQDIGLTGDAKPASA
ncbi:MAG: hypothetical protein ACR2O8_10685, partial [Rhizobiaceae bacterium]